MTLYDLMSRLFPNSFRAKVVCLAFLGIHIPLLGFIGFLLARDGTLLQEVDLVLAVLAATLGGTFATILALGVLLSPIRLIERRLDDVVRHRETDRLPEDYADELGNLMRNLNRMIERMEESVRRALQRAEIDVLTGVMNRAGFDRLVPAEIEGAVLFFDIDRFKSLNDSLGHAAGDTALRDVARTASGTLRETDIFARFGGEEFVAWLPGIDGQGAAVIADRLRRAIAGAVTAGGNPVTVSVGVAATRSGALPRGTLIERADRAVYAAKAAGRNRIVLDEPERGKSRAA